MSKRFFALALTVTVLTAAAWMPSAARASSDFAGHWAEPIIGRTVADGYVNGYPDGTFRPDAQVTRAELVKLMVAAGRLPAVDYAGARLFGDTAGHWVVEQGYMGRAWTYGVVDPSDGHSFDPDQPATRIFTAVTAVRLLGRQGGIAALAGAELDFGDAATLPAWARGWVKQATLDQILTGYPDGTLRAQQPVTRAEAVVIVQRTLAAMTAGTDASLQLSVDGQAVTPPVPLAVREGYVYVPATAVYGAIPGTQVYDWPTGVGVTPGNGAFRFAGAQVEFAAGEGSSYRLYGQTMLPLAPVGGQGSLPYLSAVHDAAGSTVRVTKAAGWPGESLPATLEAAALCAYPYGNVALHAGAENGLTPPQFCDGQGNPLVPVSPVVLTVSVDPSGPLRLRSAPGSALETELRVQLPWDGPAPKVAVSDDPAAVPEGPFRITYTAPGGQSAFNTLTVTDRRPYQLLIDPVADAAAGQAVTVTMRLVDRYGRVISATTEDGHVLTVTDPDGAPVEAVPMTASGSRGLERWIVTNGVATFTLTPPKAGVYRLSAELYLASPPLALSAKGELVVR